jgi:hypothetical protein
MLAMSDTSLISIAHYRVKPGHEEQFAEVLRGHQRALQSLGLVTDRPVEVFLGSEKQVEGPLFIEIFEWVSADGSAQAHTHPEVSQLWESMGELCEARGGRPMFEFPTVRPYAL